MERLMRLTGLAAANATTSPTWAVPPVR